ncbi:MAG TPA: hypothetical protein VII72_13480 [Myxococcota bacterium]
MRPGLGLLLGAALALACGAGEPRRTCDPSPPPGSLGAVCGFANPEDVAWAPAAQLLLVSQMRHASDAPGGSLAALTLGPAGEPMAPPRRLWPPPQTSAESEPTAPSPLGYPACSSPPEAAGFAPHGLALGTPGPDGELPVAVVGHGAREAIELFALRGAGEAATLRWSGCIPLPANAIGNDVWLDEGGAVWVTNYQPALGGLRGLAYTIAGGLGLPTGEVLRWRDSRWESVAGTRGANPNGLLLLPGHETLAVAFSGSGTVRLRPLAPEGGTAREVETGGHPDNLSLGPRATLRVAVHTSGLAFLRCRFGALPCAAPWKLMEIDPATGAASELLSHDGSLIGGVSSAVDVGDRIYLGAVFDDRIGVWKVPTR